jgi:hypothetical protein
MTWNGPLSTVDPPQPGGMAEALLGRDGDLALIHAFLGRAGTRGEALLLPGEPGVGKTLLLDVAGDQAAAGQFAAR